MSPITIQDPTAFLGETKWTVPRSRLASGRASRAGLVQDAVCGNGVQRRLVLDKTECGARLFTSKAMRGQYLASPAVQEIVLRQSLESAQYTALACGGRCREAGIRPSMGSVGEACDNAMCESFFATLECQLLARRRFASQAEARMAVFSYIEGWYNPARRHSGIGYLSPIAFEANMADDAATS